MPDERAIRAAELFQEAWMLLLNLNDLRVRLPEPNMPSAGKLPPDWNEFRSYAVCVDTLRSALRTALLNVVTGLEFRNEQQIRTALLPSSAKYRRDAQAWLRWLDETMGPGEAEGQP
jgi:hypothetical protein